ncbi:MAG: gliding motility protein GldL, partial [Tannerellaceae bacterium]|nr:gliding motility protein GldL [Tannerellaceae bacterium]
NAGSSNSGGAVVGGGSIIGNGGTIDLSGLSALEISEEEAQTLSESIKKLNDAAGQISKMGELTEVTEKYVDQLSAISGNMERFSQAICSLTEHSDTLLDSYRHITDNSEGVTQRSRDYVQHMETLNRNIAGLNTIYEIQLKSISSQIETIEHINSGLNRIREMYDGSVVDSSVFHNETERMTRQLTELNKVYTRLLQALTTNAAPAAPNTFNY